MTIRTDALPELSNAWDAAARDLAANDAIQIALADFGGFRTAADTALILNYRDQDYAAYVAQMQSQAKTPLSKSAWRPILPYGQSLHDVGAARDARIVSKPAGMSDAQAIADVRAAMERAGLQGISSLADQLHFELPVDYDTAAGWWDDYQNQTGRYASDGTGDDGGDDGSDDSGIVPTPSGQAVLSAVIALAVAGTAYVIYRRFAN